MAEPRRRLSIRAVRVWFFLLCAGISASAPLSAADVSVGRTEVVVTVLAAGGRALPEGLSYLESPDKGTALSVSAARRTEALPATVGQALVFGIPRANPAEGESRYEPLCSLAWPAGATERVLVLLAGDDGRLRGVAINDDERVFPPGTMRVVNLINRPIMAQWGDFTGELPPGVGPARPYPAMSPNPGGGPVRFKVRMSVPRADGSGSNTIYAGRAEASPRTRTLVLVREVRETDATDDGEVYDAGVSYHTRWVVDAPPAPSPALAAR